MTDVVATYGLDYGDFRKGLAEVERHSAKHYVKQERQAARAAASIGRIAKGWIGGMGARAVLQHIGRGVEEYAKISTEAAEELAKLRKFQTEYFQDVGRVYTPILRDFNAALKESYGFVSGQVRSYQGAVATVMKGGEEFGESPEHLYRAQLADEESQAASRYQREYIPGQLDVEAEIAAMRGDEHKSNMIRERARHMRENFQINAIPDPVLRNARADDEAKRYEARIAQIEREKRAREELAKVQEREAQTRRELDALMFNFDAAEIGIDQLRAQGREHEADEAAVRLRYAKEEAQLRADAKMDDATKADRLRTLASRRQHELDVIAEARERERVDTLAQLDVEIELLGIQALRASGAEEEADQAQRRLSLAKAIAKIQSDSSLSDSDKAAASRRITEAYGELDSAAAAAAVVHRAINFNNPARILESGLGGRAILRGQVFGNGQVNMNETNAILRDIRNNTGRPSHAVFN